MLMQDEGRDQSSTETNWQFKPGETIAPGSSVPAPETPSTPVQDPAEEPTIPAPDLETVPQEAPQHHDTTISWSASEFMSHNKSAGWYMLLILAVVVAAAVIFLVTRSIMSSLIIVFAGALLGAFAFMTRQPRTLQYSITQSGVQIGQKLYPFGELKAFTIQPEGPINSIVLIPMKRFMPPISMYCDPKDEDRITDTLSAHLPFDEEHNDPVDNFMRKIRF